MTRSIRLMFALVGFLSLVGWAGAQPPPETKKADPTRKSGLEEVLDQALLNNPDLNVALAKVREAEANLSRTRLQVLQKVVTAHHHLEECRAAEAVASAAVGSIGIRTGASKSKQITTADYEQALATLAQAKSRVATAQAGLNYLLGKPTEKLAMSRADRNASALSLYYMAAIAKQKGAHGGPALDRLRKALDRRVEVHSRDRTALDVLEDLRKELDGIHIQIVGKDRPVWQEKMTASLKDVPVGAALQLLEDVTSYRVIVREYGLLIAPADTVPPGALPLNQFWQSTEKSKTSSNLSPGGGTPPGR